MNESHLILTPLNDIEVLTVWPNANLPRKAQEQAQ